MTTTAAKARAVCLVALICSAGGALALFTCSSNNKVTGYVPRTVTYPVDVAPYPPGPVIGDGSTPSGGTPPAFSVEPAEIATTVSVAGWTTDQLVEAPIGSEAKFRTIINASHVGVFDPIRFPGKEPAGHCHTFFGNRGTSKDSTYTSLRTNQTVGSTAAGGPLNLTAYWYPCLLKPDAMGDGITRIKKPNLMIVYYTTDYRIVTQNVRIPRGLSYILGVNMDDPDDTQFKAEIAAANDASGAAGGQRGYKYNDIPGAESNGWHGWVCDATGARSKFLANADGSDALNDCPATSLIYADATGPVCWDGQNLSSPSGYKHVRYEIQETNSGRADICPSGWWRIPNLKLKVVFSHQGKTDYTKWRLSSDDMATFAGHPTRNGESFHTDWFGAWDYPTMLTWMRNCNGIEGVQGHQCDYSTISPAARMISDSPAPDGSRNPQVVLSNNFTGAVASDWFDMPATK
jgi:Domain of unknown function (DUF1996)